MKQIVMIIDDQPQMLESYERILSKLDCRCIIETDPVRAMEKIKSEKPDIVITDLKMPVKDGMEVLNETKTIDPTIEVILCTAYGTVTSSVQAVKNGAFDYIEKPFDSEKFRSVVRQALEQKSKIMADSQLLGQVQMDAGFGNVLTQNNMMEQTIGAAKKIASLDASVLILGESGTGKDLFARNIHAASPRKNSPFIPINCAAIPPQLIESELFGYEKGAFTSAFSTCRGLVEYADKGTLFLDEIGDLNIEAQAKFLQLLETKEFRRVGGRKTLHADVRFICATNRNLESMIKEKTFREDLYYRLNVIRIQLPPLRDRKGDIDFLSRHFLSSLSAEGDKKISGISAQAINALNNYNWPGNVRELYNTVYRAFLLCGSGLLDELYLPEEAAGSAGGGIDDMESRSYKEAKEIIVSPFEKKYLEALLRRCGDNISLAARKAEVDRKTIRNLIKKHNVAFDMDD